MSPKVKSLVFLGAVGVGAYVIWQKFFNNTVEAAELPVQAGGGSVQFNSGSVLTPSNIAQGVAPGYGVPQNIYLPGGPINGVPSSSLPFLSTPLAPGQTKTVTTVTQEDIYTDFPNLPSKAAAWDCNKLKEMRNTYTNISKKDKKAETKARAKKMAAYLDLVIQSRPC